MDKMKVNTIHSESYCIKRIAEIKAKNKDKEMSLGDVLLLDNFERILKEYQCLDTTKTA